MNRLTKVLPAVSCEIVFEHLRRLDPTGVHQLAAINSDTDTKAFVTFRLANKASAEAFLKQWGSTCNIYYSGNEVRPDLGNKRATKSDILNIRMIGADLDPRKDVKLTPEVLRAERGRLDSVRENLALDDKYFYSSAVDSGGGIQICWNLEPKLSAAEHGERAECQTRGILRHLGAEESTADTTRLFRAPGTWNFPNESKRKQGRHDVAPTKVIDYIDDSATSLDELSKWVPPVAVSRSAHSKLSTSELSIDMAAVEDVQLSGVLPAELQNKLDDLLGEDEKFNQLWHGNKSAVGGSDTSGSAFNYALAVRLRKTGRFTPTEYGQILAVWEHSSENLDERQITRAWARSGAAAATEEFDEVFALPLEWVGPFDARNIPQRQFVLGRSVAKQHVTALISPPGVGKTTFLLMAAVAVATGRDDITGFTVGERTRVLLWNQEDELDELKRRLLAVMTAFDVKWSDLEIAGKPGIMLGSGVDRALMIAKKDNDKISASADASYIEAVIRDNGIGVAIFDPFVELHPANENDNVEIAAVARVFRRIAVRGECGVVLAHHTRKPPNGANRESFAGDMDMGRGAGSLNGVARMVVTLYTLDAATAKKYGVTEDEARKYIRLDDGKANMSLVSAEPRFFRREGVTIGGFGGEEVGVLRPVKLSRTKSATETKADEDALTRETIREILQKEPERKWPVTKLAARLIELGTIELISPDTLTKRIKQIFGKPVSYDNGVTIKLIENGTIPGERGRKALLVAEFAENAKQQSGNLLRSSNFAEETAC